MKLIRDKCVARMEADGVACVARPCHDIEEFVLMLKEKLVEEAREIRGATKRDQGIEEMGDLYEVLETLRKTLNISHHEILETMDSKRITHGGFSDRTLLLP